jgi:hypothetical protein
VTKFEIRYGNRTAEVESKEKVTMEQFLEFLESVRWLDLDDEPVSVQTRLIDSVKMLKE